MKKRVVLRIISMIMLIAAIVFVITAVSCPTLGRVIYIGKFRLTSDYLEICYVIYVVIMIGLFVSSFFVKKNN